MEITRLVVVSNTEAAFTYRYQYDEEGPFVVVVVCRITVFDIFYCAIAIHSSHHRWDCTFVLVGALVVHHTDGQTRKVTWDVNASVCKSVNQ